MALSLFLCFAPSGITETFSKSFKSPQLTDFTGTSSPLSPLIYGIVVLGFTILYKIKQNLKKEFIIFFTG